MSFSFPDSLRQALNNRQFQQKRITLIFRLDDYSSRSATDFEVKLINAFRDHEIPCTIGVVPYVCDGIETDTSPQNMIPLTPKKATILKNGINNGILEAALHGYAHQTTRTPSDVVGPSEFAGLAYDCQKYRIAEGKRLLEEMLNSTVSVFIPPWNSYDRNTLRALEGLAFTAISPGVRFGDVTKTASLKFLPGTCQLLDLPAAVDLARNVSDPRPIVVVWFHEYDFFEVNPKGVISFDDFHRLLTWVTEQPDLQAMTMRQAIERDNCLDGNRFAINKSLRDYRSLTPPFLRGKLFPFRVYLSTIAAKQMRVKDWSFILIFYGMTFATFVCIPLAADLIISFEFSIVSQILRYAGPVIFTVLLLYSIRNSKLYYRGAILLTIVLGLSVGVWLVELV